MKLTIAIKEKLVERIMKDTNLDALESKASKELSTHVRKLAIKKVPSAFTKMKEGNPPEWFYHVNYIRDNWKGDMAWESIAFEPFPCPHLFKFEFTESELESIQNKYAAVKLVRDKKRETAHGIKQFLWGCPTDKHVCDAMPEFKKYFDGTVKLYPLAPNTNELKEKLKEANFKATA